MRTIPDIDALILLATALASKRRPAALAEIVSAADVLKGTIPYEVKLGEAFYRLSADGLIRQVAGGFTLSPEAEKLMGGGRRKIETTERLLLIKENLAAYEPQGEHEPIFLPLEQIGAAIAAHRTEKKSMGRNLLMPKATDPVRFYKRDGQWRRAAPSRGRKA
jgi:hypothetical protein